MNGPLLLAGCVALLVSLATCGAYRVLARRQALLDHPNERSSHEVPTPRGGGLGIVAGVLAGLFLWSLLGGALPLRALGWLAGALLVAGVSFVDDLRSLPALPRLVAHLLGALLLAVAGSQGGDVPLLVVAALAFAWVVVATNAYNFMDGVDGLAAAQAITAGAAYAITGSAVANPLLAIGGLLIASASVGFLWFNRPPARLFMGDVGSTFLGFSLAALPLLANLGVGGSRVSFLVGPIVLAPFLFDSLVTLFKRIVRRERWFEAHRSHYYQRLVQAGWSHGQVSGLYAVLAVWAGVLAVMYATADAGPVRFGLIAGAYVPMLGVVLLTWRLERGERPLVSASRPVQPPNI